MFLPERGEMLRGLSLDELNGLGVHAVPTTPYSTNLTKLKHNGFAPGELVEVDFLHFDIYLIEE
jgi:hypothetical protein